MVNSTRMYPSTCLRPYTGRQSDCKPSLDYIWYTFHSFKFLLVLVLVHYHLYGMDLQIKILWFFENQHNWSISSFILISKSEILNMIFWNTWNQIMKTIPSHSAYHSKFVTNFLISFHKNIGIMGCISKGNLAKLI